ncbi:MAG: nucleotidyltransferase domain-containing protein [Pseudomonadota bacterium]
MFDDKRINNILGEFSEIAAVYLFGSAASGKLRNRSDVDVALLLQRDVEKTRQLEIRLKLMALLEDVFERPTEVVIINDVSLLLFSEIMKAKKLIYEKDTAYRIRFESQKRREYLDFKPHMIRHGLAFRKRLMEG